MFTFSFKMTFDKVSNISTNCKNIPVAVMLFFHRFAGAQVTSERVSHELSATIWKQSGRGGDKKGRAVQSLAGACFVSGGQLKLKVFEIIIQRIYPFSYPNHG